MVNDKLTAIADITDDVLGYYRWRLCARSVLKTTDDKVESFASNHGSFYVFSSIP